MADNLKRNCFKCGLSPRVDPAIKLYRFPKPGPTNSYRCETWAKFCFPEGPWYSIDFQQKLYGEHRMLCCKHFEKASFVNFIEKKLCRNAVPNTANIEVLMNQPIDLDFSTEQPATSHFPSNVTYEPLQSRVLASIQMVNVCDSGDNIILNTLKNEPQPGPSGVLSKKITELDQKLLPVNEQSTTSKNNDIIYKKCRSYVKKVCKLKNQIENIKLKHMFHILNDNESIEGLINHITPSLALVLQEEVNYAKRKYVTRKWDMDQKIIALRLYKRSPSTYQLLRRLWCLPAPSMLKRIMRKFHLNVGIYEEIFPN